LEQLVYRSIEAYPLGVSGIAKLTLNSGRKNNARGITGILAYHNGEFVQVLEGESTSLDDLYMKIYADPRHRDVTLLQRREIKHRDFTKWSMSLVIYENPLARGSVPNLMEFKSSDDDLQKKNVLNLLNSFSNGNFSKVIARND
jgi:hypothetical protein